MPGGWEKVRIGNEYHWVQCFENVQKLYSDYDYTSLCTGKNTHRVVHFKRVNFIVCELYLDKLLLKIIIII